MSFSMHSFRHLIPTMARQLRVPDSIVGIMGHWASRDPMPGHYDSADCCVELTWKAYVRGNYCAGWRLVKSGEVAANPMITVDGDADPDTCDPVEDHIELESVQVRTDGRQYLKGAEAQISLSAKFSLPDGVVQVLHSRVSTVHLYVEGTSALCNSWKPGFPSDPSSSARFASSAFEWSGASASFMFCTLCYRESSYVRIGASRLDDLGSSSDSSESSDSDC